MPVAWPARKAEFHLGEPALSKNARLSLPDVLWTDYSSCGNSGDLLPERSLLRADVTRDQSIDVGLRQFERVLN